MVKYLRIKPELHVIRIINGSPEEII